MAANPFDISWEDPIMDALPDAPAIRANRDPYTQYPPSLPHDIALAVGDEEVEHILGNHGLTMQDFDYISDLQSFKKEVSEWRQKIQTEGYGFKYKLRAIAEAYIPEIITLLHDPVVAPSVKTDLYKYITKCAGLEPTKNDQQSDPNANRITINIAPYAASPEQTTIDITPRIANPNERSPS